MASRPSKVGGDDVYELSTAANRSGRRSALLWEQGSLLYSDNWLLPRCLHRKRISRLEAKKNISKTTGLTVGAVCCSYVPTDAFSKEAPSAAAAAVAAAVAVANAKNKAVVDLKSEA